MRLAVSVQIIHFTGICLTFLPVKYTLKNQISIKNKIETPAMANVHDKDVHAPVILTEIELAKMQQIVRNRDVSKTMLELIVLILSLIFPNLLQR